MLRLSRHLVIEAPKSGGRLAEMAKLGEKTAAVIGRMNDTLLATMPAGQGERAAAILAGLNYPAAP